MIKARRLVVLFWGWANILRLGGTGGLPCQKGTLEQQRRLRRLEELDDFNDELAGRNTGKMRKSAAPDAQRESQDNGSHLMDAMELAAMVWNETFDRIAHEINTLSEATQIALSNARQEAQQAAEELREVQDRATTLPDGRRVYRDEGGNVYTEDGNRLSPDQAAGIQWAEGATTWNEYLNARKRQQETAQNVEDIERYRDRIEALRQRLQSATPGNPSQEELERLESELDQGMPAVVRKERDRLMSERPEPESRAAVTARADVNLSASDLQSVPSAAVPKVAMPSPI